MAYCYTHRSVPSSAHSREAPWCNRWELTHRRTTGQCVESERLWDSRSQMGCLYPTLPHSQMGCLHPTLPHSQHYREQCRIAGGKTVRTSGDEGFQGNSISQTQQNGCPHKLTETVAEYQDLHWFRPNGVPSAETRRWTWTPP